MAYVQMADLQGKIPASFLVEALDDDQDGTADPQAWTDVQTAVGKEIDGVLGTRFPVPFANPIPSLVSHAALVLAQEAIYQRRGKSAEENPFTSSAKSIRELLMKAAEGKIALSPETKRTPASASVVSEPARAQSAHSFTSV